MSSNDQFFTLRFTDSRMSSLSSGSVNPMAAANSGSADTFSAMLKPDVIESREIVVTPVIKTRATAFVVAAFRHE